MSQPATRKRLLAPVAAAVAAVIGLSIAPLTASAAFASDSSTASSLAGRINAVRALPANDQPAFVSNGFVTLTAQEQAVLFAAHKSTGPADGFPIQPANPGLTTYLEVKVSRGPGEAARLAAKFVQVYGDSITGDEFNVAGYGVKTHGSTVYGVAALAHYLTQPYGRIVSGRPRITGTAQVGKTLTAHYARATPAADTYRFLWIRDGVILNEGSTHTVMPGELGYRISVIEVNDKLNYAEQSATSGPTAKVRPGRFSFARGRFSISTLSNNLPVTQVTAPFSLPFVTPTYTWYRDGHPQFFTGETYPATDADKNHYLQCKLTYASDGYTTRSVLTPHVKFTGLTFGIHSAPFFERDDIAAVGETLHSAIGQWNLGNPVYFTITWKVNGKTIRHQNGDTLLITKAMLGKRITVTYTGRSDGFRTLSETSAKTPKVVNEAA